MDITHLRYFLKTAEVMNYTRAAESLFISRQALRQAITALERELGRPLFENDHNHLSLTGYGEYLQLSFENLLHTFEEQEGKVKEFFRRPQELQMVVAASMTPFILPNLNEVVAKFRSVHPHIVLTARQVSDDEALEAVERGEADLGCVIQMPTDHPGCTATVLRVSDVAIGSGPNSPLYEKPEVTPEDLARVPLISMGNLAKIAAPLWRECQQRGLTLDYRVITNTIDALYLIRNGPYSGFNTYLSDQARVVTSPVTSKSRLVGYTWEIVALCPKSRPNHAAGQLLAAFLRDKYAQ